MNKINNKNKLIINNKIKIIINNKFSRIPNKTIHYYIKMIISNRASIDR